MRLYFRRHDLFGADMAVFPQIHNIRLETSGGRVSNIEFDEKLMTNYNDMRNIIYGQYWSAAGLKVGRYWGEYPIAIIDITEHKKRLMCRVVDGIRRITSFSYAECVTAFKFGMSQIPHDGIVRLLLKMKEGLVPLASGAVSDNTSKSLCPMAECLPDDGMDWLVRAVNSKYGNSTDILAEAWVKAGLKNLNSTPDGFVGSLPYLTRKDILQTLICIRDGDRATGRFACPYCGKSDIKSKSGHTLHMKSCESAPTGVNR